MVTTIWGLPSESLPPPGALAALCRIMAAPLGKYQPSFMVMQQQETADTNKGQRDGVQGVYRHRRQHLLWDFSQLFGAVDCEMIMAATVKAAAVNSLGSITARC